MTKPPALDDPRGGAQRARIAFLWAVALGRFRDYVHANRSQPLLIAIAVHHAAPEYTGEFTDFMYRVIDTTSGAPGLLEFRACREPAGRYLAGFSRWESLEDFRAALPTIRSLAPLRKPEWSTRPDDVITLVEAERSTD